MTSAWRQSTIGEEFHVQLGKRLDAAVNRGELKLCINNRGVRWGRIDVAQAVWAPLTKVDIGELRLVAGDVLVCEGGEIGRASVWRGEVPEAYFLNTLHRLRSRGKYNPDLLAAFLERWATTGELLALVGKSSLAHLTKENLLRVPLRVPSPEEQARIATALRSVAELIVSLERLIAKQRNINQGIVQELMTGRTRLPGYSGDWHEVRLREAGGTYGGLTGKDKNDFGVGSGLFVTFVEVMAGARLLGLRLERVRVRPGERQNQVQRGDVLFNGSSETPEEVALAAVIDFDPKPGTFLNNFCFGYRLNDGQRIVPAYLAYFFRSTQGRMAVSALAQGATRYNIAKTKLIELAPLLPSIPEQRAIVGVLRDAENAIEALERRLKSARDVKTGVMQELLTGRTRLPVGAAL